MDVRALPAAWRTSIDTGRIQWLLCALLLLCSLRLSAQNGGERSVDRRDSYSNESVRPVLVKIEFEGNEEIGEERIAAQIETKATSRPWVKRFFGILLTPFELNPFAPEEYRERIRRTVDSLAGDIRYLNLATVGADTTNIRVFYEDHGFHDARVRFKILLDTSRNTAIVRFLIQEGAGYPLRGFTYLGLDSVPKDVRDQINRFEILKLGKPYSKDNLTAERDRALEILRNNGFAYPGSGIPTVFQVRKGLHPDAPFDTAFITLYPGRRYHFGRTVRVRDTSDRPPFVDDEVVMRQLEYSPGDWYSKQKVDQTLSNLYALGTFDLARVDTVADPALTHDDTLGMRIYTKLRDPREFRAALELGVERRVNQYITTLGFTPSISHANLTGQAQRAALSGYVRTNLQDFLGELQYGISPSFQWPSFFFSNRLSLLLASSYDHAVEDRLRSDINEKNANSLRARDVTLRSDRFGILSAEGTYRFPTYTYLSYAIGRAAWQWNKYVGITDYITRQALDRINDQQINKGLTTADSLLLSQIIVASLTRNIYRLQVLQGDNVDLVAEKTPEKTTQARDEFGALKSSYIFGGSMVSDRRNDIFAPTDGHFAQLGVDIGFTGWTPFTATGAFAKGNFDYRFYIPWTPRRSFAFRGHVGAIYPFGRFPLIPATSRFTAGGANSIRGWGPREMLATTVTVDPALTAGASDSVRDIANQILGDILNESKRLLGGLAILEVSAELRARLFNLPNTGTLNRQLNNLGVNFFIDAGNAYFRDLEDDRALVNPGKFIENIGLSIGMTIGYDTPVGPFQFGFGWPIYDPVNRDPGTRWIWQHPVWIGDFAWQLAIGYAF
jgi:outer membrane protein assembly factor BamA